MGKIIRAVVAIVVGVAILWGVLYGIAWFTADPLGSLKARQTILSGEFRVAAYQHFFNLYSAVQGLEASLEAQSDLLAKTTDPKEQLRVRANIAGIMAERGRAVAQYNADARKDYTEGQFRDLDLPFQLNPTYTLGGKTTWPR